MTNQSVSEDEATECSQTNSTVPQPQKTEFPPPQPLIAGIHSPTIHHSAATQEDVSTIDKLDWRHTWSAGYSSRGYKATEAATSPIKRVAILSVHTCPLALMGGKKTGGMNVYVRDVARALGQQGVQVDVFTRSQDACQPTVKHDIGFGGRVIHIAAGPETPIPTAEVSLYIDEFTQGVIAFARAEGIAYNLIHSHYWISGLVAIQLREQHEEQWQQIPIVHMFHTLGEMKNQIALAEKDRAPQERLDGEKVVVDAVDIIIAATPSEKRQLTDCYGADPSKIQILPPGVDLAHFQPIAQREARARLTIPAAAQNILFAGRIERLKGIDTLLQAAALLKARHANLLPQLTITIIGGDPHADTLDQEMARLQELRCELELCNVVAFIGAKDHELLPDYYAAADVVVMPSHYESFGMVALEAMAMGRAVIASEVGGLAHLVAHGETGFHIPPHDAETLASRLFELLINSTFREQLGEQAHAYARNFGWETIVGHMQQIYSETVAE